MRSSSSPVVLVTGCSSGLGLHTAVEAACRGARVVATMRDLDRAEPLRERARAAGVKLDLQLLDVCVPSQRQQVVASCLDRHGRLDVLVNNAGYGSLGAFEQLPMESVRRQFETNLFGAMELVRLVLPQMRAQGGGRILNVSSVVGRTPLPLMSTYVATKHALEGWSHSLSAELVGQGIQVCCVAPGFTRTDFAGRSMQRFPPTEESPYIALFRGLERNMDPELALLPPLSPKKVARRIADLCFVRRVPARVVLGLDGRLSNVGLLLLGIGGLRSLLGHALIWMGRRAPAPQGLDSDGTR